LPVGVHESDIRLSSQKVQAPVFVAVVQGLEGEQWMHPRV
jgi:hypothetical protein